MRTVRRWGRFNLVGLGGFVLQLSAIAILTRVYGWHYSLATIVGIELAILSNFHWDCRWTWRDRPARGARDWIARLGRYQLAKTASLAANLGLTAWLVTGGLPVELANAIAVASLSFVNFFVSDAMVFRPAGCQSSR
jgi:putative flippase GtrA